MPRISNIATVVVLVLGAAAVIAAPKHVKWMVCVRRSIREAVQRCLVLL